MCGKDKRIGVCLDSCHLLASGYDVRTIDSVSDVMKEFAKVVGKRRLRCVHVNDSKVELGSNRDRHATLPNGLLGKKGLAAFLSEPAFEKLPALLETADEAAGEDFVQQVKMARKLRAQGLKARAK